jgi:uncharacterized coiled-coil DUF342 family protein
MKTLQAELQELKHILKSTSPTREADFTKKAAEIHTHYPSAKDADTIADFIMDCYKEIGSELEEIREEITVRKQLADIADAVSFTYLSKHYFGKSKQWFNNKLNGCMVSGKPARFTSEEKQILNSALADLSKRIGSICIS